MQIPFKAPPTISAYMQSDARFRFIMGPFGSGKSSGSIVEIPRRAAMQGRSTLDGKRKTRFAVIRNTMPQLRDTTLKTWFDWFPNGTLGYWKETGKTYFIRHDDIDCEVIFRALDDADDVKNLLSLELTGAYINEMRETPQEIIEGLDGRIGRYPSMREGGPTWMGIWGDTNPPEEGSYCHSMFEGFDPKDTNVIKLNTWQVFKQPGAMMYVPAPQGGQSLVMNPLAENVENLTPGYYENLAKDKDEAYIKVYILGNYGTSKAGKRVHTLFQEHLHVARAPLIPNPGLVLLISADFGLTPAIVLKQQDAHGRILTLDECVTFGMGIERAIQMKLKPLLRRKYDGYELFITGDPSGDTGSQADEKSCADIFKREFKKERAKVKFAWSNNPIHRMGATDKYLAMLTDMGPAYVVDPSCKWLISALNGKYHYPVVKGQQKPAPAKNDWSHVAEANQYGDMYFERGGKHKADQVAKDYARLIAQSQSNTNPYASPR